MIETRAFPRIKGEPIKIVDIAGGNGATMSQLKSSTKRPLDITILDQSKSMLGDAKKNLGDDVELVHGNMMNPSSLGAGK
jgi:ubiquinone/menaquinone biosynthesis C-methylase UbiE